jgi:hypothetical protein
MENVGYRNSGTKWIPDAGSYYSTVTLEDIYDSFNYPIKQRTSFLNSYGTIEKQDDIFFSIGRKTFQLPKELSEIKQAIVEAKDILYLKDDWDDEGADATDEETFLSAISFLVMYSKHLFKHHGAVIDTPFIDILRDGSIGILWDNPKYAITNGGDVDEITALWMLNNLT